jgi:hypothetical protein
MRNGLQSSADTATRRPEAPGRGSSSRHGGSVPSGSASIIWTLMALVLVAGILYAEQADSQGDSPVGWSLAGGTSSGPVEITGYARGLYPGASTYLLTKVTNRSSRAVSITRVWVRIGRGAPGCPSRTLRAGRYRGQRLVGAGRTWLVRIPVVMSLDAGGSCQGARYPVLFFFRERR